jgi:superoxide dismutase, Fe-Mn family
VIKAKRLPYDINALDPFISERALRTHYQKHYMKYVAKTNELLEPEDKDKTLLEIIKGATGPLFNNAAQTWNHEFFWASLSPNRTKPGKELLLAIKTEFGQLGDFEDEFAEQAIAVFGSSWIWLLWDQEKEELRIATTMNAATPIVSKTYKPLFCLDLWEHAYYLDYTSDRQKYIDSFWDHVNWEFASENFKRGHK